ncbi:hypothetical protein RNJ44_02114 [Nakaseomyces bracarensis]|uniref:Phosphoribulokinase/uridine kinase domain-containing protein n=1 Tax=Nakaseomyces bracarensis TaxID=273131 RepID=A0ABR4NMI8_9SACH
MLLLIAGGHYTGVQSVSERLRDSFAVLFPKSNIKIINLDHNKEYLCPASRVQKKYNNEDYDFEAVYQEITHGKQADNSSSTIDITIVCGCYALYDSQINKLASLKVFIDSDGDVRLIRTIRKENVNSPEQLASTLNEYLENLRPEMEEYIVPTRNKADLIIPCSNEESGTAIIVDGIMKLVDQGNNGPESKESIKAKARQQLYNFQGETMDLQRDRYYDLS